MEQKNTIVKCFANPNCLFNHNGVCDNYVINIGADGGCQEYIETASEEETIYENTKKMLEKAGVTLIEPKGEVKRGQRAKCNFYEDGLIDPEIVKEVCQPFLDVNDELQKIISSCILTPEETGVGLKRLASLVDQSKRAAERCKYLSPEEKEWTACPYMVRGNCTHPSADNITACCYMSTEEVIDEI